MAKRKRLTPADPEGFGAWAGQGGRAPETKSMPLRGPAPIAQVAGEAATRAALDELTGALQSARDDGRLIELLPLDAIDAAYLVRDRIAQDEEEMGALLASLRARGQQSPIEVIRLPDPVGECTHGLISGWRRLAALRRLFAETRDERFATVKALVIAPESAQAAYVAMVEENEIRVNLSHYERARIALKAVQEGVYPNTRAALQGLYGATTRSKRSKIGSFIPLVEALDTVLFHPAAISEKLGLALAKALAADPGFAKVVTARLQGQPRKRAAEEARLLKAALAGQGAGPRQGTGAKPHSHDGPRLSLPDGDPMNRDGTAAPVIPGLTLRYVRRERRIELTGAAVSERLHAALKAWLKTQGQG
jgi:hypothetical protein